MKINWLIEDGPFEEDINPLLEEVVAQGHNLKKIKYSPFESGSYNHFFDEKDCVIFYGSINLALQLQRQTPWIPGPIVNFKNYDCTSYYSYFGSNLTNQKYKMMPYGEVKRKWNEIVPISSNKCFIRPNSGRKSFAGHLIDEKSLKYYGGPVGEMIKPDELVVLAPAKKIDNEWRFVIHKNKEVIAGCQYKKMDKLFLSQMIPSEVLEYVEKIIPTNWTNADPLYVLDIAQEANGRLSVLEINSFSCSGLYCCSPKSIVYHASKIAWEEWEKIWTIQKPYLN